MKRIYLIAAATLALVSCDKNEENIVLSSEVAQICATIGETLSTRAADSKWANGDRIGITTNVMNDTKQPLQVNMKYTTDGGVNFTGNPIYFYNPMEVTAYYPFSGTEGTASGSITIDTRAANQTDENRPGIDFLWDKQTKIHVVDNKPQIHFSFTHKMSKLTLTFENGDGVNVSKIVSYRIEGLVMDGTFDTETGDCVVTEAAAPEPLSIDLSKGTVTSGENVAPLILIPQKLDAGNVKLSIKTDEIDNPDDLQEYTCNLSFGNGELKPGYNYEYKIKVSKTGLEIEKTNITDWISAENLENPTANSAD